MADSLLNIVCSQDIECSNTGTILGFSNIYPGYQDVRPIRISNNRNIQCDLLLQSQGEHPNSLIYKYTEIYFSNVTLSPKQKKDINIQLYISPKAGNEFANLSDKLNFNIKINCTDLSTPAGSVAGISTTPDSINWWLVFIIFSFFVFAVSLRLAKKQE